MAAGSGKVALVNSTAALPAAGCPSGASIIDFVGYGSTANCREGSSTVDNSPGPSNNATSAQRKLSGCQDVNVNQQDFVTAAVAPRNTATAMNSCSCNASYLSMSDMLQEASEQVHFGFVLRSDYVISAQGLPMRPAQEVFEPSPQSGRLMIAQQFTAGSRTNVRRSP